ncbi:MAG: T9SS type A sorting domain-containing protein [Bacteroidia bacterium]|nr:T9SS type A sorting domain-containing protein [Bacteroidia bacterium]
MRRIILFFCLNSILSYFIKGQTQVPCPDGLNEDCKSYFIPSNCSCPVTPYNEEKNCCCGRDYFFYSYSYADKQTIGFTGSNDVYSSFCRPEDYDFTTITSFSSVPGDWLLLWYDEFEYSTLDQSFYNYIKWGKNYGSTNIVYDNSQIVLSNGKLKLNIKYDPDPSKLYSYYGPEIINSTTVGNPCYPCSPRHFDYVMGKIITDFNFPKNIRIQSKIKFCSPLTALTTDFWLFGVIGNYQEIDIFESGKYYNPGDPLEANWYNLYKPNYNLRMTYHSTKYQMNPNYFSTPDNKKRAEGVLRYTGVALDQSFNQFDLIYDDWKIEWWFNSNLIWRTNKYYDMSNYWGKLLRRKNFRRKPISNYNQMQQVQGGKVAYNVHFPHIGFPSQLIFDVASLKSNGDMTDINPSTDIIKPPDAQNSSPAEMEYLKIWIRADCNKDNLVTQNNPHLLTSSLMNIIETGRTIRTDSGKIIKISAPVWWGKGMAIYAATEEIEFNDGFEVDETGDLFAFITTCETAWDHREIPKDSLNFYFSDQENDINLIEHHFEDDTLFIFPNPTSDHFHISMAEEDFNDLKKIEIVNTLGQVKELPIRELQDISDLAEGVYMVKFYFSTGMLVVKSLIIKR